jgi:hypothetical protein
VAKAVVVAEAAVDVDAVAIKYSLCKIAIYRYNHADT